MSRKTVLLLWLAARAMLDTEPDLELAEAVREAEGYLKATRKPAGEFFVSPGNKRPRRAKC